MSVRIRGLRKTYRSIARRTEVLKGIDLDVHPGEVVGLIGPNGAGKTTLMSCLLGFLFPDEGEITIGGLANDDLEIRQRTGFVPERMNFDRVVTGGQFLFYLARLSKLPRDEAERRIEELTARLDIAGALDRRLSQYSRGMLQRIAMCQALLARPEFLFLDEPASGLDPHGVMLVRELINEQRSRGVAVLLNSHQLSEVEKICDRVLFLKNGVIAEERALKQTDTLSVTVRLLPGSFDPGQIEALVASSVSSNVLTLTAENEAALAAIIRRLVEAGAGVVEVKPLTTDLEEIFRRSA
ncbi:MAG TPA: ABC transporter ATP-binding protein [Thermoanaerobaculia bacterium]|nr:ABC transporter ATP-binding protein [Thermoanaerobaculia bacterium]